MKNSSLATLILLTLTIILSSWGVVGYRKISESASLSQGEYYLVLNTGKLIHLHKLLVQDK